MAVEAQRGPRPHDNRGLGERIRDFAGAHPKLLRRTGLAAVLSLAGIGASQTPIAQEAWANFNDRVSGNDNRNAPGIVVNGPTPTQELVATSGIFLTRTPDTTTPTTIPVRPEATPTTGPTRTPDGPSPEPVAITPATPTVPKFPETPTPPPPPPTEKPKPTVTATEVKKPIVQEYVPMSGISKEQWEQLKNIVHVNISVDPELAKREKTPIKDIGYNPEFPNAQDRLLEYSIANMASLHEANKLWDQLGGYQGYLKYFESGKKIPNANVQEFAQSLIDGNASVFIFDKDGKKINIDPRSVTYVFSAQTQTIEQTTGYSFSVDKGEKEGLVLTVSQPDKAFLSPYFQFSPQDRAGIEMSVSIGSAWDYTIFGAGGQLEMIRRNYLGFNLGARNENGGIIFNGGILGSGVIGDPKSGTPIQNRPSIFYIESTKIPH